MTRLVFAAFCLLMAPMTVAAEGKPNIILIMADDLGFADLGCYGSEIETPNLDSLAASGLRFTQFYNTAKCHSSRVSLLTGLYCDQAGSTSLSRGATIAEVLSSSGYFTAMVGKWHLSKQPTDFGFQRYWGHLSGATNYFTGDNTFRLNGEEWKVPESLNGRPFYTTHAVVDFALEFLEEATRGDKPFFLYTAFNAPHYPLQAPEDAVRKYDGRYDAGWDRLRVARHRRQLESGLLPAKWKLSPRRNPPAVRDAVLPLRHGSRPAPGRLEAGLRQAGEMGTLRFGPGPHGTERPVGSASAARRRDGRGMVPHRRTGRPPQGWRAGPCPRCDYTAEFP